MIASSPSDTIYQMLNFTNLKLWLVSYEIRDNMAIIPIKGILSIIEISTNF